MYVNSVIHYLDIICQTRGNDTAITTQHKQTTYIEYNNVSKSIGTYIISNLKKVNMPIAVYMPRGEQALEAYMGVLYSGNYYSPIPYGSPKERAKQMLSTLKFPYLITSSDEMDTVREWEVDDDHVLFYEVIENLFFIHVILSITALCDTTTPLGAFVDPEVKSKYAGSQSIIFASVFSISSLLIIVSPISS